MLTSKQFNYFNCWFDYLLDSRSMGKISEADFVEEFKAYEDEYAKAIKEAIIGTQ